MCLSCSKRQCRSQKVSSSSKTCRILRVGKFMPWQYPILGKTIEIAFKTLFNDLRKYLLSSSSGKVLGMSNPISQELFEKDVIIFWQLISIPLCQICFLSLTSSGHTIWRIAAGTPLQTLECSSYLSLKRPLSSMVRHFSMRAFPFLFDIQNGQKIYMVLWSLRSQQQLQNRSMNKVSWNDFLDSSSVSSVSSSASSGFLQCLGKGPRVEARKRQEALLLKKESSKRSEPEMENQKKETKVTVDLAKLNNHGGDRVWLYIPFNQLNIADVSRILDHTPGFLKIQQTKSGWHVLVKTEIASKFIHNGLSSDGIDLKFLYSKLNQQLKDNRAKEFTSPGSRNKKYTAKQLSSPNSRHEATSPRFKPKDTLKEQKKDNQEKKKKFVAKQINEEKVEEKAQINKEDELKKEIVTKETIAEEIIEPAETAQKKEQKQQNAPKADDDDLSSNSSEELKKMKKEMLKKNKKKKGKGGAGFQDNNNPFSFLIE